MADVTVKLCYLRQSPPKVRQVVNLVRGRKAGDALHRLEVMPWLAAQPVKKLLKSGLATARAQQLGEDQLWIETIQCDQGPALKRWRHRSRGRASQVKKFSSHITLTLSDRLPKKLPSKKLAE